MVLDLLIARHAGNGLRFLSKSHKHHVQWSMVLGLHLLIVFLVLTLYFRGSKNGLLVLKTSIRIVNRSYQ